MVLPYMVLHGSHQYTPVMLPYMAAPWIRHGYKKNLCGQHLTWEAPGDVGRPGLCLRGMLLVGSDPPHSDLRGFCLGI